MFDRLQEILKLRPTPEKWQDQKEEYYRKTLGRMDETVSHAIIPFSVGGGLDLYYYPNHLEVGTVIGTMEAAEEYNRGARNKIYRNCEFVIAIHTPLYKVLENDHEIPEYQLASLTLNCFARYAQIARISPQETLEFPADFEIEEMRNRCFIMDSCPSGDTHKRPFGLMLILEIHRSEMEYAMKGNGALLLKKLKDAGYYPYSGIEREAVL